ncbi:MAG: ABC transporter permease [Bacteroidetes bacterium]|nr:ABC transporter permease [Bacteroidota bacterium]
MLKNFFKIALRNLFRQKTFSLLNLMGLSLGIACVLLLALHVKEELSYDKNFSKHDRIYRMEWDDWSKSSPPLAAAMQAYFPEIAATARFSQAGNSVFYTNDGKKNSGLGYFADSSAPKIFDFKTVAGDPVAALSEPGAIVLTRSMARRFFGDKDPVGQPLTADDQYKVFVKAVIEDLPANTHLHFDYLMSMTTFSKYINPGGMNSKGWMFGWTYVLLNHPEDVQKLRAKLQAFYLNYRNDITDKTRAQTQAALFRARPITDIHLHSNLIQEMGPNSSIVYIYIFIGIGALILLIACINFVNLFTTQTLKRLKEVAVRKVLGAPRSQLIAQFLGEAFILAISSAILAIFLYDLALPFYNNLTGRQVTVIELLKPSNLLLLLSIVAVTGILSGVFPALFISGFQPASTLKGNKLPGSPAALLRKGLVVFQFIAAGFLIISTVLVYKQMMLFHNKQLGFDKDQVAIIRYYGDLKKKLQTNPDLIKTEFLSNPNILSVAQTSNIIGDDLSVEYVVPSNVDPNKQYSNVRVYRVDENYLPTLNIELKEGRNFSRDFHDSVAFILNESAAKALGSNKPLATGTMMTNHDAGNQRGPIVGIVKDFHFASLHSQIEPLVLEYRPQWTGNLFVKMRAGTTAQSIAFLRDKVAQLTPNELFICDFLDSRIANLYKKEDNMSTILRILAAFSILISCLGLFGLAAYAAEVRTREIGIRKVIGASTAGLVRLLTVDFMIPVLVGNVLSWPLAWWALHTWLQEFTYRIDIGWTAFALSLVLTAVIALMTVGFRCWQAARANPVKSLRAE